ncbi:hypothetical protein ABIB50_003410 [Mucilaginibacter sp. UYCu711]
MAVRVREAKTIIAFTTPLVSRVYETNETGETRFRLNKLIVNYLRKTSETK